MAKHSFFAGAADGNINTTALANAGYNLFGKYDSTEGSAGYQEVPNGIGAVINTPNVTTIGSANIPLNNAKAGTVVATGNSGELATVQASSFMGGVNNGEDLGGTGKRYYYIGCINYNNYNLGTTSSENTIPGNNVDGMYSVDEGIAQYTTAGDVGGSGTDYTICLLSNNKNGQSAAGRQGTRITFRFANGGLGAGLSALAYYVNEEGDYGLQITALMNDENAAGRWLGAGYGILKGAQPTFWDGAN
jgi:hypothetical protein